MHYSKNIDSLRAISILFVLLFHANLDFLNGFFNGGFVGVDIFFVISGYLITGILTNSFEKKESIFFIIKNFYTKRARRLLPALYTVILITIIFSYILLPFNYYEEFYDSVFSSITFISNFFFAFNSNYFDTPYFLKPLVHTWSLSVEFQFYIFYPLILYICIKYLDQNKVIYFFIIISILNLTYVQLGGNLQFNSPYLENNLVFFNPPTAGTFFYTTSRIWEFLCGAICFLISEKKTKHNLPFLYYIGLFLILFSLYHFSQNINNPSIHNIIPVAGACFILVCKPNKDTLNKFLCGNLIVGLGLISYSVYLLHFPIFAFSKYINLNNIALSEDTIGMLAFFLSLFFGYLSWRFIENPMRNLNIFSNKNFYISIFSLCILITSLNIFFNLNKVKEAGLIWNKYSYIHFDKQFEALNFGNNNFSKNNKIKILILGDSQSEDFYKILKSNNKLSQNFEFSFFSKNFETFFLSENDHSSKENREALIKSNKFFASDYIILASDYSRKDLQALESGIKFLKKFNKKLIITTMFPTHGVNDPVLTVLLKNKKQILNKEQIGHKLFLNLKRNDISKKNILINSVAKKTNILVLDRTKLICNFKNNNCPGITEDNYLIFKDYRHLTDRGSKSISQSDYLNRFFTKIK